MNTVKKDIAVRCYGGATFCLDCWNRGSDPEPTDIYLQEGYPADEYVRCDACWRVIPGFDVPPDTYRPQDDIVVAPW